MVALLWCHSVGLGHLHFSHFVTEIREIILPPQPPTLCLTSCISESSCPSIPPTSWGPGYKYPNISINCEENVRIQSVAGMLEVSNGGIEVTSVSWWRDQSKSDCLCHIRSVVCQQVVNSIGGPQTFHTINNIRQQNAKYVS